MRPFPAVVRIEPSGLCNFRCIHCPIGTEGGHREILSFERFVDYFEALPILPRVLMLYHGGEPLLNKELELMIAYAKTAGVKKVAFNTNAALLNDNRDLSLVDELRVSFDGDSPEDNDQIRVNSRFNKHAARVKALALSDKRPKVIRIYNANLFDNMPAKYLLDYFKDCPDMVFEGVKIRKWARLNSEPHELNDIEFCSNLFETFTILSNGDVPMCCEDLQADDIQGNVNKNTPAEIWERMEARRAAFARKEYPKLCQSCWVTRK